LILTNLKGSGSRKGGEGSDSKEFELHDEREKLVKGQRNLNDCGLFE
jgi:hypothetical protein